MTRRLLVSILSLVVVLLVAACGEEGSGNVVTESGEDGSGNLVTETRSVGEFTAVDISVTLRAEITIGTPFAVEVEFDDNLLEHLQIEVRDGTLQISCSPNCNPSSGAIVRITMPEVQSIEASGASRAEVGAVSGGHLVLTARGASRIKIRGTVDGLEIDASAASHIEAAELVTNSLDIHLSGASHAEVEVRDEVSGALSGASKLTISGEANPTVDVDTSGSSSVSGG